MEMEKKSIELFEQMQQEGIQPNHFTYTIALSVCADLAASISWKRDTFSN